MTGVKQLQCDVFFLVDGVAIRFTPSQVRRKSNKGSNGRLWSYSWSSVGTGGGGGGHVGRFITGLGKPA